MTTLRHVAALLEEHQEKIALHHWIVELRPGRRHFQLWLAGRMVLVLPRRPKGDECRTLNARAALRRAVRALEQRQPA